MPDLEGKERKGMEGGKEEKWKKKPKTQGKCQKLEDKNTAGFGSAVSAKNNTFFPISLNCHLHFKSQNL